MSSGLYFKASAEQVTRGTHAQERKLSENFFLERDRNYYGLDWEKISRDKSETKTSNYIYLHLIH